MALGGISVIRISGEKAIEIGASVFSTANGKDVEKMEGYTCAYGKIISDGVEIDDGIITVFRAPKSFTGEDVCEISCHGGIYVTKQVLRAIIKNGAVPAQAGEFTKRAFLNGKMSLTQAEAVMDVISAQGEQALRAAVSSHEGALYSRIRKITDKLVSILGELAAWVDYPEEDLPDIEFNALQASLSECIAELDKLLLSYDSGRILREGIDTAIVGKPNVGKSTLMNLLLGYERSIVTDIEGTTRDIVEESARIGEIVLRLSDTAGIHDTEDIIEGVGVNLAKKKISEADLIIAVFDNSRKLTDEDFSVIESVKDKACIAVLNKTDLEPEVDINVLKEYFNYVVEISAKNNKGIDELKSALEEIFRLNQFDATSGIIANERQKQCVEEARKYLVSANDVLVMGETYDAVTVLIDKAADDLLELSGEKATEAVVNDVFSRFCVGK
jgi:tRNA modification GTPase